MESSDLVSNRLSYHSEELILEGGQNLTLSGSIEDSIGTTDRFPVQLNWWYQIAPFIAESGYYSTEDGRNVILIPDLVSDRATGEILMLTQVVTLNMTHQQIQNDYRINQLGGPIYNGIIDLDGQAPVAQDDFVSTFINQGRSYRCPGE
jgi:hypothetical protein